MPPRILIFQQPWLISFRQILLRLVGPLFALGVIIALAARFELSGVWHWPAFAGFIATWVLGTYLIQVKVRRILVRWKIPPLKIWGSSALVLGYLWLTQIPTQFDYRQLACAVTASAAGMLIQRFFVTQAINTRRPTSEMLRWWGLAAICGWLIQPYATPYLVGGGDAHHYAQQLADAAAQMRAGNFELFVGQSAYAFNGDIHPLRTAPYFSYVGGVLSLIAGDALPPTAAQNLLIVLSLGMAVGGLYLLLIRLKPKAAWPAFVLTAAFASSPGVLAMIYSGDMVASWLTLPWLPIVFYAIIRLWDESDQITWLLMLAAALAMIWLAHAPIAFWTTVFVALSQGTRLLVQARAARSFWLLSACAALCLLLCSYVFISVGSLDFPNDPNLVSFVRQGGMLAILKSGWSGLGRPIDPAGENLIRNLQLSPALWLAAILGLASIRRYRWVTGILIAGAIGMLALLNPWAALAGRVWSIMPEAIIGFTDKWPMQRFYPILSALLPFLAILAWPQGNTHRSRLIGLSLIVVFGIAVTYSIYDSRKLVARGYAVTSSPEMSQRRMRPENVVLSRYSYEYYGRLPKVFTNGTVSPWMQNRLLNRETLTPIDLNLLSIDSTQPPADANTPRRQNRTRHRYISTEYGGYYSPPLKLEPNQSYFVRFIFNNQSAQGTLQLLGQNIYREYNLPMAGEEHAFGMGALQRNGFSLWTTAKKSDEVEMKFYKTPGTVSPENLGDAYLHSVDPDRLPLRLLSLNPYKISVQASKDTWLESPKIFVPGYSAEINGQRIPVERSPDGLVMIPVPAGQHQVDLNYTASPLLRLGFWGMFFSWVALLLFWLFRRRMLMKADSVFLNFGRGATVILITAALIIGANKTLANLDLKEPPSIHSNPIEVKFTLPVGRLQKWETLWSFNQSDTKWTISCYYQDGQNMRVGLSQNSKLYAVSEAFQINYLLKNSLIAKLMPAPAGQTQQLKVWINQRLVLRPILKSGSGAFEGAELKETPFNGEIINIAPSAGPIE